MSTRTMISLIGSALITGAFLLGLTSIGPVPVTQPSTIDGLPVTNLPGITVHPSAQAASSELARDGAGTIGGAANNGNALLHELTVQVTSPHLRMPYYSFASASLQISKD